jgi:hypothetical protein
MEGGVTSRATVTVNVQVVRFVQSSVAVQVTVVVPGGNSEPEGGEHVTATLGSALSVAIGRGHDTCASGTVVPQSQTMRFVGH